MLYVLTSNNDKMTPAKQVMWKLHVRAPPATVYLNFRSQAHVSRAEQWGWLRAVLRSTVSTGVPNGPYSGPVYSKVIEEPGTVDLMGSNCDEGTYFVFVELPEEDAQAC